MPEEFYIPPGTHPIKESYFQRNPYFPLILAGIVIVWLLIGGYQRLGIEQGLALDNIVDNVLGAVITVFVPAALGAHCGSWLVNKLKARV